MGRTYVIKTMTTVSIGVLLILLVLTVLYGCLFSLGPNQSTEDAMEYMVSHAFKKALNRYKADLGGYPETNEGLKALIESPIPKRDCWKGPYLDYLPTDGWGSPFQYSSPGTRNPESFDLWSLGPDGIPSEDDIGNW